MFVFDVRFMIEQFKKLVPDIYNLLIQLPNIYDDKYKLILNKLIPNVSQYLLIMPSWKNLKIFT